MRANNQIYVKDMYKQILTQLQTFRTAENFDFETALIYINRAVQEAFMLNHAYKTWAFTREVPVTNNASLDRAFIEPIRVWVSPDGQAPYTEARKVSPFEYEKLSNWKYKQSWNSGVKAAPIYTIWGNNGGIIKIFPNIEHITGTAPNGVIFPTANYSGIMECYSMPLWLYNENDVIPIPFEYSNLVLWGAISRYLAKTANLDYIKDAFEKLNEARIGITKASKEVQRAEKKQLDNFEEVAVPYAQPRPEPGEMKKKL